MNRRGFLQRLLAAPLAPAVVSGVMANWPTVAASVSPVTMHYEWGIAYEVTWAALCDDDPWLDEATARLAFSAQHINERLAADFF